MPDLVLSLSQNVYNMLNCFLPGVSLCLLLKHMAGLNLMVGTDFEVVFTCYFVGMIASRIGSLIVEPIMKQAKIISERNYDNFLDAERKDAKITVLSATNNSFRTYTAVCLIAMAVKIIMSVKSIVTTIGSCRDWIILVLLVLLFACSYKKQDGYLCKRISNVLNRVKEKEE